MKTPTIKKICDKNNFGCIITKRNGIYEVELSTYTDYGQDWCCDFVATDIDSLLNEMYEFLDTYDADYEASLWIGNDGHGINGAPYYIADIVADMNDGWNKLNDLYEQLKQIA